MALWIESHVELHGHVKTARLKRALGVGRPQAVGHLHCLWWWAAQHAETGDLSGLTACDIADAAEWEGDPDVFLSAMVASGFIDTEPMALHGWEDYFGKLLAAKKASRERAHRGRERAAQSLCSGTVRESTRTVREPYADSSVPYTVDLDLDLDRNPDQHHTPTPTPDETPDTMSPLTPCHPSSNDEDAPSFVGSMLPEETTSTSLTVASTRKTTEPKTSASKGTRMAVGTTLDPAYRSAAEKIATTAGLVLDVDYVWAGFVDWWASRAGKDAFKTDWLATWRNWIRMRCEKSPKVQAAVMKPKPTVWKSELIDEVTGEHWTA